MPHANSAGVKIYFEDSGAPPATPSIPILFLHEYMGDHRSWQDQVRHFARGWRCICLLYTSPSPRD